MPLPKVKSGEKENDFINRCMSDEVMNKEFKDVKARVAVCYAIYEKRNDKTV